MKTLADLIEYIKEGNEQAVRFAQTPGLNDPRWSGKSHAYLDVLAFIENEMMEPPE